jgi:carboxynorspermidine decarboxylase
VLYALKPLALPFVLERMVGRVDGFATSSLFEARLARSIVGERGVVHFTTPGLRGDEVNELAASCDAVALNSLGHWERFACAFEDNQVGLRVNPRLSLVDDPRYDPCRRVSKLGVPLRRFKNWLDCVGPDQLAPAGLLVHTNCDAMSFKPLLRTVKRIEHALAERLGRMRWFSLGGGYLFDEGTDVAPLAEAVDRLKRRGVHDVVIEPGAMLVRQAGVLVSEVIDLFRAQGRTIAVLDTTVNHMPEVFEYQFEPDVAEHDDNAPHEYTLAGSSCLAGDVFGTYGFREPLQIGSRVTFTNAGAYTLVKSHMFNGINLPTIYSIDVDGAVVERRRFEFHDFLARCGADLDAVI